MDISKALRNNGAFRVRDNTKVTRPIAAVGGLNTMDSPLQIPAGELVGCLNYEPSIVAGYMRAQGYERFDGHPSPSNTAYVSILYSSVNFTPAVGATVTESGTGATGKVVYNDTANSTIVLTNITGTFSGVGTTLTSGGQTAACGSGTLINQGGTRALTASYYYQKWLYLQTFIGPVGGSLCTGPVLGVWPHAGAIYAFRGSADGTQVLFFTASAATSGWVNINLGYKVVYSAGVYSDGAMGQIPEGSVLTGASSGATFTVKRCATQSGTWGTDAAGYFIVSFVIGSPTAGENLLLAGSVVARFASMNAQKLAPGGKFYFRSYNFNSSQTPVTGYRIYGVTGVGHGFEYSPVDDVFVNISTGMTPDTPTHLEIHADYLFYGFPGGSLQNSGFQLPLNWQPVTGADERSVEDDITFMREDVSQTLNIGTQRRIWQLTGLQLEQFQIRVYSPNNGAIANTDEMPGQIVYGESRGITTISASAQFGDFEAGTITDKILSLIAQSFIVDVPIGAILTRKKNLYRLIFASGDVYNLAINASGQFTGWTITHYAHTPSCASSGLFGADGITSYERAFIGCTDGYVRELDNGFSFDGQIINHFLKFAYTHAGSPDYFKRWRKIQIDIQSFGQANIYIGCDCDYGARSGQVSNQINMQSGGTFWDVGSWDQFTWDAPTYQPVSLKLELEGYNVSLAISGGSANDAPFTVSGMTYQYTPRIINRNTQEA